MVKLDLLMVTHTAVAVDQATDHQQAMGKLDLQQDLMDRPPNQSRMAVDQATGKLRDQATGKLRDQATGKLRDQATGKLRDQAMGKLKDTADQATDKLKDTADQATGKPNDTVEVMEDIKIGMEGVVVWRRKPRRVLQKTKRKPLKHREV